MTNESRRIDKVLNRQNLLITMNRLRLRIFGDAQPARHDVETGMKTILGSLAWQMRLHHEILKRIPMMETVLKKPVGFAHLLRS